MFKIMIVDDEKMIKKSLRVIIERAHADFLVTGEASNGQEALRLILENPPQLLITDISMPVMDGLELIAEVKRHSVDTEIIVISGFNEFEYAQQAIRFHVADYVLKPIDPQEFERLLLQIYMRYQQRNDHRELFWKLVGNGDELAEWIWTLQEEQLRLGLAKLRTAFEEYNVDLEFIRLFYHELQIYVERKLAYKLGRPAPISPPIEAKYAMDVHAQFQENCSLRLREVAGVRNWGQSHLMKRSLAYIDSRYSDSQLSLSNVAEQAGISMTYFSRLFKEETGMNFLKYVIELRIAKAKNLLLEPSIKVGDVAERVGFTNYYHFAKAFKKMIGKTPTEYRCMHIGSMQE